MRDQAWAALGKATIPTSAIVVSQSVKTTEKAGNRGHDAGKHVAGQTRRLVLEANGFLLWPYAHPANEQDRDAATTLLADLKQTCPTLELLWADVGCAGDLVGWCAQELGPRLEIVRRQDTASGFVVQAHRCVVERTFGWLGRCRRLSKDYEHYEAATLEAWIHLALIRHCCANSDRTPVAKSMPLFIPISVVHAASVRVGRRPTWIGLLVG